MCYTTQLCKKPYYEKREKNKDICVKVKTPEMWIPPTFKIFARGEHVNIL